MSIYDVIRDDHRKVSQLFEDIREARDPDARYTLALGLRDELLLHSRAEENVLYDRLAKAGGEVRSRVVQNREEHTAMEALLARLCDMEPGDRNFLKVVRELESVFDGHAKEEETELFQQARQIIGDDADDRLARRLQREKGRLQPPGLEPV